MSSELYTPSFASPHGATCRPGGHNVTNAQGDGAPTTFPASGYEKGALFQDRTNGKLYINTGTSTVAVWVQISGGAGIQSETINTADTTIGGATLTAAEIVGGVITRSGSVAAYTDTTATAALIIAALPTGTPILASWWLFIRNTVAFNETIAGGSGVTVTGNTIVPPNSVGQFLVTYASATTITIFGVDTDPLTVPPLVANTAISTAGAGTLTAASLVGGVITRTGPLAAYSDTVDTAANIIAALPNANIGQSWQVVIKNTVAFNQTIVTAAGVTLSGQVIIPPNSAGNFLLTYNGAGTVTMQGLEVGPLTAGPLIVATNLTTNGAGTVTAAGVAGGITNRTGSTSAFTDTLDTTANIIAALPNANPGQSFWWTYYNNTLGTATLAGGDGSTTITGTLIPQTCWAAYLVTVVTASTITVRQFEMGPNVALPASKFTVNTGATLAAGDITGAAVVHYENNASNATVTTRTGTLMFADIPNCQTGFTYTLLIRNLNATQLTLTAADGSVTLSGTMTIAQNTTRTFAVQFTSTTAVTITSMGISAAAV